MEEYAKVLARNLRRVRAGAGLSVVELAKRAGVGRATLTQLEAGAGNPTLETLYALADQLGVALADLIAAPAATARSQVVRAGTGERTRGDVVEAWLLRRRGAPGMTVELYALRLHPGPAQRSGPHPAGTREYLHLHTGRALVGPDDEPLELGGGDFAEYAADVAHRYQALPADGTRQATATLLIVTPTE